MDIERLTKEKLNAQISAFTAGPWKEAMTEVRPYAEFCGVHLLASYSYHRIDIDLLTNDVSRCLLGFSFRVCQPTESCSYWSVRPSISLQAGGKELSGLEWKFLDMDKEIPQIPKIAVASMIKCLVHTYGGTR